MRHPVYNALNMRLRIGAADRDLFWFAWLCGLMMATTMKSYFGAILLGSFVYGIAVVVGTRDPQFLHNWAFASKQKNYYDPAK